MPLSQEEMIVKIFNGVQTLNDHVKGLVTKEELRTTRNELMNHIDGFVKLHETLDVELAALRIKCTRLEDRMFIIEQRVGVGEGAQKK